MKHELLRMHAYPRGFAVPLMSMAVCAQGGRTCTAST